MDTSDTELKELYEEVVAEVIKNVEELFIEDGVENIVLEDLKRIWMDKLLKSNAIPSEDEEEEEEEATENAATPVQIILLSEPVEDQNMLWEIQLPLTPLSEQLVQQMYMENVNTTAEQDRIEDPSVSVAIAVLNNTENIEQTDGPHDSSSDSTSEVEEDSDKAEDNVEQPLNSDDDISEEEDSFDTENIIVCQYEKISRRFNKWKFYLKSGIMNLNGKDHVFKRFIGEAEW